MELSIQERLKDLRVEREEAGLPNSKTNKNTGQN